MSIDNIKLIFKSNKGILFLLLVFTILYTFNLDKYPAVWTDEALFINPALNLALYGFLGTNMIPDFFNISHFTYWQMPVYLILLASSFKLFGFGLIQARLVSVFLGFFTVLFTYLLAKRLYNQRIGLLSAVLLIFNPLFFFVARDARMDIAVVFFTLIALYFLLLALKNDKYVYYFGAGFFAMLSVLSHPNGIFGVICIVLIYFLFNIKNFKFNFKLKEVTSLILGPLFLIIPYLYYISLDFPAFLGQFNENILNSSSSILNNVLSEIIRYLALIDLFVEIDKWLAVIAIISFLYLSLVGLIYIFKNRKEFNEKFLFIILAVHLILLTVIVNLKESVWYLGIILPYLSIIIALSSKELITFKNIQKIISGLLCLFIVVNVLGIVHTLYIVNNNDYQAISYDIEKYIPNGSVIIGDPGFWIPLHTNYSYYANNYINDSTLKKVRIKYILYDPYWSKHQHFPGDTEFLKNNCTLIGKIPFNQTVRFSTIEIYEIKDN